MQFKKILANTKFIIKETFSYDIENRERLSSQLLFIISAFFVLGLLWAYFAKLDQVVTAQGTVISSSRLQVIEHFEGGRVEKIHVQSGQVVKKDELLISLSPIQSKSEFNIAVDNVAMLSTKLIRLTAEYEGKTTFELPKEIAEANPQIVNTEKNLFKERRAQAVSQLSQRRAEINSSKSKLNAAEVSAVAANEELKVMRTLIERGLEAKISLFRAEKSAADANSFLTTARQDLIKAEAAYNGFLQELQASILTELTKVRSDLTAARENSAVSADRADRASIRSPIDGVVNRILVSTEGGTVKAGERVAEIVPSDSGMIVEAKVSPGDIGFIRLKQEALVKLTTYDSSVFGALKGSIAVIGSDSITEEKGEQYYLIKIELQKNYLAKGDTRLQIMPGMVAQVDVITGKRTVFEYIFSPFTKMMQESFREK
jgi:adhesin transport system membrane fusion protein